MHKATHTDIQKIAFDRVLEYYDITNLQPPQPTRQKIRGSSQDKQKKALQLWWVIGWGRTSNAL